MSSKKEYSLDRSLASLILRREKKHALEEGVCNEISQYCSLGCFGGNIVCCTFRFIPSLQAKLKFMFILNVTMSFWFLFTNTIMAGAIFYGSGCNSYSDCYNLREIFSFSPSSISCNDSDEKAKICYSWVDQKSANYVASIAISIALFKMALGGTTSIIAEYLHGVDNPEIVERIIYYGALLGIFVTTIFFYLGFVTTMVSFATLIGFLINVMTISSMHMVWRQDRHLEELQLPLLST